MRCSSLVGSAKGDFLSDVASAGTDGGDEAVVLTEAETDEHRDLDFHICKFCKFGFTGSFELKLYDFRRRGDIDV